MIRRELDVQVDQSVAAVEETLRMQVPRLPYGRNIPLFVHYRSTPDYVEVVMHRNGATPDELQMQPPEIAGNPHIVVRIHRLVLRRAVTDPEIRKTIRPLLSGLLKAQTPQRTLMAAGEGQGPPQYQFAWSIDRNWLVVEYTEQRASTTRCIDMPLPQTPTLAKPGSSAGAAVLRLPFVPATMTALA